LVQTSVSAVRDRDGKVVNLMGLGEDITETKAVLDQLTLSEQRFSLIMDHANDAIFYLDLDGSIQWVSLKAELLTGSLAKYLVGRSFLKLLTPETAAQGEVRLAAMRRGEQVPPQVEFEFKRQDGTTLWVEANITSATSRTDPGRVIGRLVVARDITERKQAESKLVEHARRMEILSHISQQINSVLETPVVMQTLVASAMDLIEGTVGMYGLVQHGQMVFREYNDNGQWHPTDLVFEKGYGVPGWVMTTLKPYVCQDAERDPHVIPDLQRKWGFYNFVNVPILNPKGELLGCLEILNKRDRNPFREQDLLLLQGLAASAAIALENSQMLVHRKQAEEIKTQFLERVMSAQEEERKRIAQELHDETGQSLTALLVGLRQLDDAPSLAEARARAQELRKLTAKTIEEVNRLAVGLRPRVLDDLGLEVALKQYAEDFSRIHGVTADVLSSGLTERRLPDTVETALFRIAQEALTNIAKHARAKSVSILLRGGPSEVRLIVEDDGCGFEANEVLKTDRARKHLGIHGMQKRTMLLNGSFSVESSPGRGTTISAQIPLVGAQDEASSRHSR